MRAFTCAVVALATVFANSCKPTPRDLDREVRAYLTTNEFADVMEPTVRSWRDAPVVCRIAVSKALAAHLGDNTIVVVRDSGQLFILSRTPADAPSAGQHGITIRQDIWTVGGRAAWALEQMADVLTLPELSEALPEAERAARVKEIRRYVEEYERVIRFVTERDYAKLTAQLATWRAAPPSDRVRAAELLGGLLERTEHIGLTGNTELSVPGRNDPNDRGRKWAKYTAYDIHVVHGRAYWGLEEVTGVSFTFGNIQGQSQEAQRHTRSWEVRQMYIAAYRAGVEQASRPAK